MANSKKWNIRPSHMLFSISAALAVLFGALYLFWPIAPYHEEIIGMSFHDLDALNSDVAGLMKTLVDVVGLSFLAIGIFLAYTGEKAWRERWARVVLTGVLAIYVIPLGIVVHLAQGPSELIVAVAVLVTAGLMAAHLGK